MKILVSDKIANEGLEKLRNFPGIESVIKTGLSEEELISEIPSYSALVVRSATKVTKKIIEAAENLKVIGRAGAGVDNIDIDAATKHGIVVMNTPGGNAEAAAELAVALMFATARNVAHANISMKAGRWDKKLFAGIELLDKTLGIIGTGFVGGIVARRAGALGMHVIAYDPYISEEKALEIGAELTGLDELLKRADFISIHVPKNKETVGFINEDAFNKMKRGVFFINCARGGIVKEDALLKALDSGRVAAAGIDVYESEPPVSWDLVKHPKVTATPHIGASTREAQINVAVMVMNQIGTYLTKGEIINSVNKPIK
ncbi:MAG: phosphoglycerate dehydrogenase [Spirochaetales bacterium]|nr:phosphoglycerate dehydrogenase [Spirochaetales bacterium]